MKPDDHVTPLARPDRLESTTSPSRILVVDDDAVMRDFLGRMLRHVEYHVSCAEDGEAGWDALRADRFDVLITDHEMPRLTGLDLLRRVRAAPLKVPVILISGKMPGAETDLLQLLPPGVALKKPFLFEDLLATVRGFLTPTRRAGGNGDGPAGREYDRNQPPSLGARVAG
jgi:DNA-binding response OmpR family regulator